ncbi:cytochrome c [Polaromonas eurypsychrophila]|uniref:Cytochrome c n=1 Tax=Polaromonas eurypsychrophila TaxID=1614635 RepID=A0A916S6Z9_9BURK|nr:cytochrome c [Polaromonas eurypsychrophila]GGA86383.1 cytochrome c [Polaromonas eurypsychrophila]
MKKLLLWLSALSLLMAATAAAVTWLNLRDEVDVRVPVAAITPGDSLIARGAYLARAGNCISCHSARGEPSYAGGRPIDTPFGTVYSSNLTPDEKTGLGSWSPAHFWRAMHNGRSKNGRLLYPAFPYPNYTQVTREDSDALFAYFGSLPAVERARTPNVLRFPYDSQAALAIWRALYFKPGVYETDKQRSAEWNRGAYLVRGLGHCAACHTARNALGASSEALDLAGGLIPMQNWYAPSLSSPHEAGVGDWDRQHIVALLKTGVSPRASATGPMAEVVLRSTQYLSDADLGAMAQFLKELTPPAITAMAAVQAAPAAQASVLARGAKLYEQHCAQCHGEQGRGVPQAYPALAGNRAVTMAQSANLMQIVLNGGYAPATAGNPRPFGMPPFVLELSDGDIAAVLTHIRQSWGNRAGVVTPLEVNRMRASGTR